MFRVGICSFSFHHMLAAGEQDMFGYIRTCKELGCTQLDPWNAHLTQLTKGDEILFAGRNPGSAVLDAAEPLVTLLWRREVEGRVFDSPERRAALEKSLRAAVGKVYGDTDRDGAKEAPR